jgi:uncharacterized protein GlcG (DUF336 family)
MTLTAPAAALTTDLAQILADAALKEGASRGFAPLCVVVLDAGGHLLLLKRDHHASIGRPEIATGKAAGCLAMGFGGRELARRAAAAPAFMTAAAAVLPKGIVPVAGGVLIRTQEGHLLGAVGVSGEVSDNDEICAAAGIRAAGFVADTGD